MKENEVIAAETVDEILSNPVPKEEEKTVQGLDKLDMDQLANIHLKLLGDLKRTLKDVFDEFEDKGMGKRPVYEAVSQMLSIAGTYPLPREPELAKAYKEQHENESKVVEVMNLLDDLRLNYFILSASKGAENKEKKDE